MPLTNAQHDAIMRICNARAQNARRIQEQREAEVYARIPALAALDEERASLSLKKAREAVGLGDGEDIDLRSALSRIASRRKELLQMHGYTEEWLEPPYTCPICRDTGYVGREKCRCFRQLETEMLYEQAHLDNMRREEGFSAFLLDYYPDDQTDPRTGRTPRQDAADALGQAESFVRDFGQEGSGLFIYGNVGTGKTFLSRCIAGELLRAGHSVLYITAYDLFDSLRAYTFEDRQAGQEMHDLIFDSELLIIDDLGTELSNTFVASQLFLIVNERILRRKQTIISTNLSLSEFRDTFSDRTFSRIYGHYALLQMSGPDIRTLK